MVNRQHCILWWTKNNGCHNIDTQNMIELVLTKCSHIMVAKSKTYSSRDSHVVTHRSTNLPFNCLCMAERTGCPVFS
ncbi:hypothetical protein KCU89_g14420, partial [Aureobasidium melanogenum]